MHWGIAFSAKEDSCNAINTGLDINARLEQVDFVKGQVREFYLPDRTSNLIKTSINNNQGSTETLVRTILISLLSV